MKRLMAGIVVGVIIGAAARASATPQPSIEAQLDIDGNCAVNFPGDTLMHAKITLGVLPMPTWLPTCGQWYATWTPTAEPTATDTPEPTPTPVIYPACTASLSGTLVTIEVPEPSLISIEGPATAIEGSYAWYTLDTRLGGPTLLYQLQPYQVPGYYVVFYQTQSSGYIAGNLCNFELPAIGVPPCSAPDIVLGQTDHVTGTGIVGEMLDVVVQSPSDAQYQGDDFVVVVDASGQWSADYTPSERGTISINAWRNGRSSITQQSDAVLVNTCVYTVS